MEHWLHPDDAAPGVCHPGELHACCCAVEALRNALEPPPRTALEPPPRIDISIEELMLKRALQEKIPSEIHVASSKVC